MQKIILLLFICYFVYGQEYPKGPLTDHFVNWLIMNGYENDNFDRPDIGVKGSFGGKQYASQIVKNI